jgi:N utilization substance protein A
MAALVVPGAPVSALLEHGLSEDLLHLLVQASIGTVEKLGSMTPEELESLPGIDPAMVAQIQDAVNSYYGQFEPAAPVQDEEVVREEWNVEEGEGEAYRDEAGVAPEEPLPVGPEGEEAGVPGLAEGSSTLEALPDDESAEPGVAAVERDSHGH